MTRARRSALALVSVLALVTACRRSEAPGAVTPTTRVQFETSRGTFVIQLDTTASPRGIARFRELVAVNYFDDVRFFRVLPGFVAQFGMHGDPAVNSQWTDRTIPDEPVGRSNRRGTVSFATAGPNTRSNQLFINLVDNVMLDGMGFTPIGEVVEGMDVVDSLFGGYGEAPNQSMIGSQGNAYLQQQFPQLDFIRTARFIPE